MGAFSGFLRGLVLACVTAAATLLIARYLFDLIPAVPAELRGIKLWVYGLTQPPMSIIGQTLGIPPMRGPWNPLPLGLVVVALMFGAIAVNIIDSLLLPRPGARSRNLRTAPVPPAHRAAPAASAAPDPAPVPAAPSALPRSVMSTTFNPQTNPGNSNQILPAGAVRSEQPAKIGRYEIISELGRGAMGVVYKANDPQIGRMVAIKSVLGASGDTAEDFKRRFFAEARAAGRLNHPGIMKVHDLIEDQAGHPCMVLEFFEGKTLDKLVADGRPSYRETLKIITQAAQALAFAHDNGVVHRDIKPGNIMVAASGHAVIADFGIAKVEDINMTATGTIMGTPAYMSPEQVQGLPVDLRSDIFSLGTVMYWLLTGERPFAGSTFTTVAYNVVHTKPRPPTELAQSLPNGIQEVFDKCLAKAPMDRYASAHEFAAALKTLPAG